MHAQDSSLPTSLIRAESFTRGSSPSVVSPIDAPAAMTTVEASAVATSPRRSGIGRPTGSRHGLGSPVFQYSTGTAAPCQRPSILRSSVSEGPLDVPLGRLPALPPALVQHDVFVSAVEDPLTNSKVCCFLTAVPGRQPAFEDY